MKAVRQDDWTLDRITWAARFAECLPELPPPAVRLALRQELGIPRHVVVAAIQCSYTPFILQEVGKTERSKVAKSKAYARVIGYMAALLRDIDPAKYDEIMQTKADTDGT